MAAQSTLRGRRGQPRRSAQPPAPERTPTLEERIRQLEQQMPQQPAASRLFAGKPSAFTGSRDGQEVIEWLSKIDTQIKVNERSTGKALEETDKIIVAISYLAGTPRRHYDSKVTRDGEFATYADFARWMRMFYSPVDLLAEYRQQYRTIKQQDNENINDYYLRFTELVNKLVDPPREDYQVSDFVFSLNGDCSDIASKYDDMSDFKNVTIEDVVQRIARGIRTAKLFAKTGGKANAKPLEHRVSTHSKPAFNGKPKSSSKDLVNSSKVLTSAQKSRLETLIAAKGGKFVGHAILHCEEWNKMAIAKGLCKNCAAEGHILKDCPLLKRMKKEKAKAKERDQLAALIDSQLERDYEYLCSLAEDVPLFLFPCMVEDAFGVTLLDDGATRNYVSLSFAKRVKLPMREVQLPGAVDLPNGGSMKKYGIAEFPIQVSEWKGIVKAFVIDIKNAPYDVVLGMDWHREWEPLMDWKALEMTVQTNQGSKRLRRLPVTPTAVQLDELKDEFNLISESELAGWISAGKQAKDLRMMLYFARERDIDDILNVIAIERGDGLENSKTGDPASEVAGLAGNDAELQNILDEYKDIFRNDLPDGLPPMRALDHHIDTGGTPPINRNAYALSIQQLKEQLRQIEELLKRGFIRESMSPWGAPVLFVTKPRSPGEWRMCIDYRALNNVTVKNAYPLPRIEDCLNRLGKAKHLTTLDLTSGYWQVRIADKDIPKTAFNTRYGKYEFLVMPFGLTNAPATFQTLMNEILRPFIDKFVLVYLDDILIFSDSIEEHREHVKQVLEVLHRAKLYAKPKKCVFNQSELEFCGHIVGNGLIRVLDKKVKVIEDWPQPKNVHEVRQFYGLANYYRRFIKNFSLIGAPLSELFKSNKDGDKRKNRPIVWTMRHQLAFERMKQALMNAPVLVQPDPAKPYVIETDASDFAIGYSLLQRGDDGRLHPVAFEGKKLDSAQVKYPIHEKELLAIKEALGKWKHYIENGHKTVILTDHESLRYMNSVKKPSNRLARWIDEFQGYNIEIRYRKGAEAVVPDALSRRPDFLNVIIQFDEYIPHLEKYLNDKKKKRETLPDDKALREKVLSEADDYELEDGRLVKRLGEGKTAPYIDPLFRGDFMERMHTQFGHLSYAGMANAIESRGWWPNMAADIRHFISGCPNCQVVQRQRTGQEREYAQLVTDPFIQPFQRWGIDLIGILPKTNNGNRWIITAIDYATGWPVAKAIPRATEDVIADFIFDEIYMHYGAPQEIFSDGGKNLWGGVLQEFMKKMGTKHKGSSPYHPRTNGKVERLNGILENMISKLLFGKPTKHWDLYLDQALFACRIRVNQTTKTSPFYLLYGQHPHLISDIHRASPQDAAAVDPGSRLQGVRAVRQDAAIATYERAVKEKGIRDELATPHTLDEGEWVLVRHENPQKLECKWFGPYQIIEKKLLGTYRLQDPSGKELAALVHGNRLIQANIRTTDELRRLWASPSAKDALRRQNARLELIPSEPEHTKALENYLLGLDIESPDVEPLEVGHMGSGKQKAGTASKRKNEGEPGNRKRRKNDSIVVKIPQRRWLEQIALQQVMNENTTPSPP